MSPITAAETAVNTNAVRRPNLEYVTVNIELDELIKLMQSILSFMTIVWVNLHGTK